MENIQADHRVGLEPRGGKRRRRRTDSAVFRQFLSNYLREIYGEDTVASPHPPTPLFFTDACALYKARFCTRFGHGGIPTARCAAKLMLAFLPSIPRTRNNISRDETFRVQAA